MSYYNYYVPTIELHESCARSCTRTIGRAAPPRTIGEQNEQPHLQLLGEQLHLARVTSSLRLLKIPPVDWGKINTHELRKCNLRL